MEKVIRPKRSKLYDIFKFYGDEVFFSFKELVKEIKALQKEVKERDNVCECWLEYKNQLGEK